MKNSILLLGLIFTVINLQSQNYLINFSGTGESTTIDSVTATNLHTNQSVTLPGNDTLVLKTGISGIGNIADVSAGSIIYPNPFSTQATLTVKAEKAEIIKVSVCNIYGQVVAKESQWVQPGKQLFSFSCNKRGVYIITVQAESGTKSHQVLYFGSETGSCSLRFEGSESLVQGNKSNHAETDMDFNAANNADHEVNNLILKSNKIVYELAYTQGDVLLYKCYSDKYTTIVTDTQALTKILEVNFVACTDADSNNYAVVKIGSQTWMAENLKTTRYNDGTDIALITDSAQWSKMSTPAYCWNENDEAKYKDTYGALYNWYTVNNEKLCPLGWHVPSNAEWETLLGYLIANGYNYDGTTSGNKVAKSLSATANWTSSSSTGAVGNSDFSALRNKSGFSALPAGGRSNDGSFRFCYCFDVWWTTTSNSDNSVQVWDLYYDWPELNYEPVSKECGFSSRCIKD